MDNHQISYLHLLQFYDVTYHANLAISKLSSLFSFCRMIDWVSLSSFYRHSILCDVILIIYVTVAYMLDSLTTAGLTTLIQLFRSIKFVNVTLNPVDNNILENYLCFHLRKNLFSNQLRTNLFLMRPNTSPINH